MRYLLFFYCATIFFCIYPSYKKIYIFSPPRSLSTACARMFMSRGDCTVLNEPSLSVHGLQHEATRDFFRIDAPRTYEQVLALITHEGQKGHLCIKEMAVSAYDMFGAHPGLLNSENAYAIFLVRNPHHALLSLYKKAPSLITYGPDQLGYQRTYTLLQLAERDAVHKPLLIFSEDVYKDPSECAKRICSYTGLAFQPGMVEWATESDLFTAQKGWLEFKKPEAVFHWHQEAMTSAGLHVPHQYNVDEQGNPTFSEVADQADRDALTRIYLHNKVYYDLIMKYKQ